MTYEQYLKINHLVQNLYLGSDLKSLHGYEHVKRVELGAVSLMRTISRFYQVDENLLRSSALLHDVTYLYEKYNFTNYFKEGALAEHYAWLQLKDIDLDKTERKTMLRAIRRHPFSFPFRRLNKRESIYAQLLQDADTLDFFSPERLREKFPDPRKQRFFAPIFRLFAKITYKYFMNLDYDSFAKRYDESSSEYIIYNAGGKDTLVCLPGYNGDGSQFSKLAGILPGYKMVVVNLPSYCYKRKFTLEEIVKYLDSIIKTTGIRDFTLLGFSIGGLPATMYAQQHPENVKKLIISNSIPNLLFSRKNKLIYSLLNKILSTRIGLNILAFVALKLPLRKFLPFVDDPKSVIEDRKKKYYSIYGTMINLAGINLTSAFNTLEMNKTIALFKDDKVFKYALVSKFLQFLDCDFITFDHGGHAEKDIFWENLAIAVDRR